MEYMSNIIDDECKSSDIASQEELKSSCNIINLNYSRYIHLSTTKQIAGIIIIDTIKV